MVELTDEEREIIERILKGFKHFNCFIYEAGEHGRIMSVLKKYGLNKYVRITYADPRYPHIYLMKPKDLDISRDCTLKIDRLFREGRLSDEDYYMRRDELIRQCINHYLYERVREIIRVLEKLLRGGEDVRRILEEISRGNR